MLHDNGRGGMRRISGLVSIALVIATAVSSCALVPILRGDASPEEIAVLGPGSCLAKMNGNDSARPSIVPCTEPHIFDVLGYVTWPDMEAHIAEEGAASAFRSIIESGPEWVSELRSWANSQCTELLQRLSSFDEITVGDRSASDIGLLPGGSFYLDQSLAGQHAFEAGDHAMLCSVAWVDVDGSPHSVKWPAGIDVRNLATPDMPAEASYCFNFDESESQVAVECNEAHDGERIAQYMVRGALGDDAVTSLQRGDPDKQGWDAIDLFCLDLVLAIYPDAEELELNQIWGQVDGGSDTDYLMSCDVLSSLDTQESHTT
jgi:hypothetical protein